MSYSLIDDFITRGPFDASRLRSNLSKCNPGMLWSSTSDCYSVWWWWPLGHDTRPEPADKWRVLTSSLVAASLRLWRSVSVMTAGCSLASPGLDLWIMWRAEPPPMAVIQARPHYVTLRPEVRGWPAGAVPWVSLSHLGPTWASDCDMMIFRQLYF